MFQTFLKVLRRHQEGAGETEGKGIERRRKEKSQWIEKSGKKGRIESRREESRREERRYEIRRR